jgi:hypothetical protein
MRRVLLVCLVAAMVLTAGTASAQWNLGMRMVGTGNYFPYLPIMQVMQSESEGPGGIPSMIVADVGLFGYKEFVVGYRTDALCVEGSFAYDKFGSEWKNAEIAQDSEYDLSWWYAGGAVFYSFRQGNGYDASVGFRYQYGASELTYVERDVEVRDLDFSITGTSTQFSVPIRFMWRPGDGKFAIGPEVAFKYTTGSTEYEISEGEGSALTFDGPEYTGFDTEYSLMMKFMF